MLVRLHYADEEVWGKALQASLKLAQWPRQQRFILYTPSYSKKLRLAPV